MDENNTNQADKLISNDVESDSEKQNYNSNEVNKENFYGEPTDNVSAFFIFFQIKGNL